MINIEDLTIREIKEIQNLFQKTQTQLSVSESHPFQIGKNYLIRTVTMTLSGKLKWVGSQELVMCDAAWIADTGRFADALKDSQKFNEVEPFQNDVIIGRGAIIDATEIKDIITVQK